MSGSTYQFYGTGDRIVDILLVYALSDLARRVDREATFEWSLGHDVIFTLHSLHPDIKDKMLAVLKSSSRSVTLANRLRFWLNIGSKRWRVSPITCMYCTTKKGKTNPCDTKGNCGAGNAPAYPIFFGNLSGIETIDWTQTQILSKNKQAGYKTLYVGLSPFWSKGVRTWDYKWDDKSTYLPTQVQILLLYGLSHYAITQGTPQMFIELIFSPPYGTHLRYMDARWLLELVKRIINRFSLGIRWVHINELPIKTIPLTLLSQMDLPSIAGLSSKMLSLLFISYDIDRAVPKNPRGYEEWSLTEIGNFYLNLGEYFWDFKCMVEDLTSCLRLGGEIRARIQSILIDFSYAISGRNAWLLNDVILRTKSLSDKLKRRIHLPTRDAVLAAQQMFERK